MFEESFARTVKVLFVARNNREIQTALSDQNMTSLILQDDNVLPHCAIIVLFHKLLQGVHTVPFRS